MIDLGLAQMPRQQMRGVLNHALAAELVYRLRRGADKHLEILIVAVIGVIRDFNFRGVLGQRPCILKRRGKLLLKAAAYLTRPANVDRALTRIKQNAGLFALQTVRIDQCFDIQIFQPRTKCLLDLLKPHAFAQKNRAVYVYFRSHDAAAKNYNRCDYIALQKIQ